MSELFGFVKPFLQIFFGFMQQSISRLDEIDYCFRRRRPALGPPAPAFRMRGFPLLTLLTPLGAALMLAVMVTTYFIAEFHMTLIFGIPFLIALSVVYAVWYRRAQPVLQPDAK